ncbi:leukocyte antigen CD37 [Denticeps clupeoides]|uniref:leukocyte antigen CD37 n=1 Tax=Denticeps clupeoides TaxID=299321 RepID=UPI0010A3812A|nr:leukocyte antigen CD37-like [Denticeps clupeoides]XP_028846053.1 leukocyte antigen CD37-like [Denticeps clupeoides]XP_028846054.1 leukocyte antigen CD37-like [Denticeps clupeoides]
MASECCLSFAKYFLFVFNLIFFFLGAFMLSMGVWICFAESSFFMAPPSYMSMSLLSLFLLAIGSLTTALGLTGCVGAIHEVKFMLAFYFILLTVLMAAQTVGGVLFITQRSLFESNLKNQMQDILTSYGNNESQLHHFEKTLDYIQKEAGCCGWKSPSEWNRIPCFCFILNATEPSITNISEICNCPLSGNELSRAPSECRTYPGCEMKVKDWLNNNMFLVMVVLFALIAVEICGMILSMSVYRQSSTSFKMTLY